MKKFRKILFEILLISVGCGLFGLGFSLFLEPAGMNAGGLSGLAMVISELTGIATVGTITAAMNLPLFIIGGMRVGKKFFWGSLLGMGLLSVMIDLFTLLPVPTMEPLLAALYGGVFCGVGLGMVFYNGVSTGGSDIIVRLLKLRWKDVPIGVINTCFDAAVVVLTGIVFQDISKALYSGVAIFVVGRVMDIVVYRFDYSKVAMIITKEYEQVALQIGSKLDRGTTLLHGEGGYTHNGTKVVLTAIKRQQLAELKELVVSIDPNAFIIVQEAHQVLGDGFAKHSDDAL